MTIANSFAAKLFAGVATIAMAFAFAVPAQAQTEAELQAQIDALLSTINDLQSQLGQSGGGFMSSSSVCPYVWSRSLSTGSTGADVQALQQFLNSNASTQVAATGVGSAGMETQYYGALTAAAVSDFQVLYRSDVLTPLGLVNPTGYFGPSSMAKANSLCATAMPGDDDDEDEDEGEDEGEDEDDDLQGGEADVNSLDYSDEEDEAAEGEEDVPVLSVEFDVEDGDVQLERVDVSFDNSAIGAGGESDPWDAFDEVSIWVDGDKVASADATDEDDWSDQTGGVYEFRLTNVDEIFREDTTGEIIVAVSVQGSVDVDGDATEDDWTVRIPADGLRFMDSLGLDITVPAAAGTASIFEIIEQGDNDDLDLESGETNPDATTLQIDEDNETDHLIFAVDLSAEDSENDIAIDNLYFNATATGPNAAFNTLNEIVSDFYIMIDGERYDAESYTGTAAAASNIQFDVDGDSVVEVDETVTVELYATLNDVANTFTRATITAGITADPSDIDAEGADDLTVIGGSDKNGNIHTIRLSGLMFAAEPSDGTDSSDSTQVVSGVAVDNNYGTMFLEFDITAFGDDFWVEADDATLGAASNNGLSYQILKSGVATATNIAVNIEYTIEGADENNGYFELEEGETYTVVVTIESLNPEAEGLYSFRVNSIGYNDTEDTAGDANATPDDVTEYESDSVTIQS